MDILHDHIDFGLQIPVFGILRPPMPSLRIRRIPNFFGLRTLSINIQSILRFYIFEFGLVFAVGAYKTFLKNHCELAAPPILKKTCCLRINV
jgi:hypothetical protein